MLWRSPLKRWFTVEEGVRERLLEHIRTPIIHTGEVRMTIKLQRPILVGGLGLTAALWVFDSIGTTLIDVGGNVVWAIALGSGMWWLRSRNKPAVIAVNPPATAERSAVEQALQSVETLLQQLKAELSVSEDESTQTAIAHHQRTLDNLRQDLDRTELSIAVIGAPAVGKTTIAHHLTQTWLPTLTFKTASDAVQAIAVHDTESEATAPIADITLLVIAGDITESEYQSLTQLIEQGRRVVLVFNKQDQYSDDERSLVVQHIRQYVTEQLPSADVVTVSAEPAPIKVRKHQLDGSVTETTEQPEPTLAPLTESLMTRLPDGRSLILGTVLYQAQQLRSQVVTELNQYRRQQALPLIDQSQWIAAAAAFANPVPSLDLLATAAVNAQLVMDLGKVYQQPFSMDQAKEIAGTMAKLMVQMGIVELSSQAIAPLLKSNALTFAAGGALQGISAAYLTRLAGLSLIDYFQSQSVTGDRSTPLSFKPEQLKQRLSSVFQNSQQVGMVRSLVNQGLQRLSTPA